MKNRSFGVLLLFVLWVSVLAQDPVSELAKILQGKGVLTSADVETIETSAGDNRLRALISVLQSKGVLTSAEVAGLWSASPRPVEAASASMAAPVDAQSRPGTGELAASAPLISSQSKFPVTIYGNILLNAFFDTSLNNMQDEPLFAGKQGSDPFPNDKTFGMTARQSRFGLRYQGPEIAGARLSGQVEVDFFGGKAALPNGINMDLLRLRLALGRLDWRNFSLVVGQDWSVFAPLNPTSLSEYAIAPMTASGNPWIRSPQVRAEFRHDISDSSRLQWQIASSDPNAGDYQTAQFLTARSPAIGERGRMPALDSRLLLTDKIDGRDYAVGFSGHYGRGKDIGTIASVNAVRPVDSWGAALDWSLPFFKYFALTGEAYEGRALGIFSVAVGESVGTVGSRGEHGVLSRGGWTQAQVNFNPRWQANLAYGIDQPETSELPVGNRNRNQTYMGNLMYRLNTNVIFAWEYRRFLTDFRNQLFANERGSQASLSVLYGF